MKQAVVIIGVLILIAAGYLILSNNKSSTGTEAVTVTTAGEIIDVSLDQIAFDGPALLTIRDENGTVSTIAAPSMSLAVCPARENVAAVDNVAVGDTVRVSGQVDEDGRIVPCEEVSHYLTITGVTKDAALGFEFAYRKGPNGYITLEAPQNNSPLYVSGVTLMNQQEYAELQESTDAREGPPSMELRVYRNDEKLHAPVWVERHPLESNIELATGEPNEAAVGGANAVFYVVDGLYTTDTYVFASGEHVYVLTGSYRDADERMHRDFEELVTSFTFIPTENTGMPLAEPQGKIDVRVTCESALAYMTFTSGEEAEEFVDACIAGEHPEVIDRYIQDMGLDGAAV